MLRWMNVNVNPPESWIHRQTSAEVCIKNPKNVKQTDTHKHTHIKHRHMKDRQTERKEERERKKGRKREKGLEFQDSSRLLRDPIKSTHTEFCWYSANLLWLSVKRNLKVLPVKTSECTFPQGKDIRVQKCCTWDCHWSIRLPGLCLDPAIHRQRLHTDCDLLRQYIFKQIAFFLLRIEKKSNWSICSLQVRHGLSSKK